ncbi:endonuclease domain-containing protein [Streptomyces sp. NPDC054766]
MVIVASPDKPGTVDAFYDDTVHGADRHSLNMNHLWFAFTLADKVITTATPLEALKQFAGLNVQLESPIEEAFWREYLNARPAELDGLTPQHPVLQGRYRIDFALPEEKIGIELDGYQWHSSPQAFTQDRARQRQLDLASWRIIRFSGAEINNNVSGCLRQAAEIVASIRGAR